MKMTEVPRWMHRLYAWIIGYFWLPCPLCATPFGGHEVKTNHGVVVTNGNDKCNLIICPNHPPLRYLPNFAPDHVQFGTPSEKPHKYNQKCGCIDCVSVSWKIAKAKYASKPNSILHTE
jgi:hypothetical protein